MARALVTGGTGFVARQLVRRLAADGWTVACSVRSAEGRSAVEAPAEPFVTGDLGPETDWGPALHGVDVVFHLAARVHQLEDTAADPAAEYLRVNAAATGHLARSAAAHGVRRMVLASSVKVNGEARLAPYRDEDPPAPSDPYGVSKLEAEQALLQVARETGLEAAGIRPPLVYGPGVKANMLRLFRAVDRGLPLPLGAVRNRRSLVFSGNLVDALVACGTHPRAPGHVFLVSDGEDVSTPDLVRAIAAALGKPARLLPVPFPLIAAAGALLGKRGAVERLGGSLTVDASGLRRELGWAPPFTLRQGMERTAAWYRESLRNPP